MTEQPPEKWVSAETEQKEHDFRGILTMHASICRGIFRRQSIVRPYLYVDLYAGPGRLEYNGHQFDGSPLIARDVLTKARIPYEALHYERDPGEAERLTRALAGRSGPVYAETCQEGFARWLDEHEYQRDRYGMVFSDPIRDEIPHDLLNHAAKRLPRVDLLSYVSATQYKRRRGGDPSRPFLADHIGAVDKRVALIREPVGAWHWTFVLWSNWTRLPQWEARKFHRLDSPEGASILNRLDLSKKEQRQDRTSAAPYSYREYLQHPRFLAVRTQVFERADGLCERCMDRTPTEPHHLRYPPRGTFDVPENMIAVCHGCHCEIHGKTS